MRIDFHYDPQPVAENQTRSAANAATTAGSPISGSGEDQAQLSGSHAHVAALAAQVAQLPEVRQEKVQALRQLILGGQYHPGAEKIAGAMVSHMISGSAA